MLQILFLILVSIAHLHALPNFHQVGLYTDAFVAGLLA